MSLLDYRRWLWGLIGFSLPGQAMWQYEDMEDDEEEEEEEEAEEDESSGS